jgi:hypothetical protein
VFSVAVIVGVVATGAVIGADFSSFLHAVQAMAMHSDSRIECFM